MLACLALLLFLAAAWLLARDELAALASLRLRALVLDDTDKLVESCESAEFCIRLSTAIQMIGTSRITIKPTVIDHVKTELP